MKKVHLAAISIAAAAVALAAVPALSQQGGRHDDRALHDRRRDDLGHGGDGRGRRRRRRGDGDAARRRQPGGARARAAARLDPLGERAGGRPLHARRARGLGRVGAAGDPATRRSAPSRARPGMPQGQMPQGRLLLFWGCGEHAGPGQPVVIDFSKLARGEVPPGLYAQGVDLPEAWSVTASNSTTYGDWPNARDSKTVPANSSLLGAHRIAGNYAPEIAFNLSRRLHARAARQLARHGERRGRAELERDRQGDRLLRLGDRGQSRRARPDRATWCGGPRPRPSSSAGRCPTGSRPRRWPGWSRPGTVHAAEPDQLHDPGRGQAGRRADA